MTLDYSHSIVQLATFYDCPHARLTVAMTRMADAERSLQAQHDKSSSELADKERESNEALAAAFGLLSEAAGLAGSAFMLSGTEAIYTYPVDRVDRAGSESAQSRTLTSGHFVIPEGTERQILIEVFFDPQFYDVELLFESREASEVRAHLYAGRTDTDVTQFKGAKRVMVEAEPGEYKLSIIAKLPGLSAEAGTRELHPQYVELQLYALAAAALPSRLLRPASMNYFGLLGPTGQNFGQFTYHIPEVLLAPREFLDLEFNLTGKALHDEGAPSVDVQAIETDGAGDQLDISLREITPGQPAAAGEEGQAVNFVEKHPHASEYQDAWADGVAYESLVSSDIHVGAVYRVRLGNRDPAAPARCSLKVVVTEGFDSEKQRSEREVLPESFDEVMRVKPKVPGLKEGSFIQGSRMVMETFKVASLSPFIPKSSRVYQAEFRTGAGTDDSFMRSLDFEISEQSTQLYAQVLEYSGREDLFVSVYSAEDGDAEGRR